MSKRALIVMSFLFVFTFGGAISDLSSLSAKTESKSELTDKRKGNKKKSTKKRTSKKGPAGKKKSSVKKKSGKKSKYSSKKKSKRYGGKKNRKSSKRKKSYSNNNTSRSYNTGSYTAPKTYEYNGANDNSNREYKRSTEPTESFKKEPKKEGE